MTGYLLDTSVILEFRNVADFRPFNVAVINPWESP